MDSHVLPNIAEWEEEGEVPLQLLQLAAREGLYGFQWPEEYGGTPPQDFDAFHDLIFLDELARSGSSGLVLAFNIYTMALPPLLKAGSEYLKEKYVRPVIAAEHRMALCISEPSHGSDVANLTTTAALDSTGTHYLLNGSKKWITWGTHAALFTVAARTGGAGGGGISLFVVERDLEGVGVRKMKTQGGWSAGTAFVTFDDVQVPAENLIGQEGRGFRIILENFNHERFAIAAHALRSARLCVEEAIRYARQRKTFGRRLIDHQVIRFKVAEMVMKVEATHAYEEQMAYQMVQKVPNSRMGGPVALLKVMATRTFEFCAREASQILGGSSYVREGKGQIVERLYREVRGTAIYGGSEEIMLDLAMKQAAL